MIRLTRGQWTAVSDRDYVWVNQWKWRAMYKPFMHGFYAVRSEKRRTVYLHVEIAIRAGKRVALETDHKNGVSIDNTRSNLRPVSHAQNTFNRRKVKKTASRFKGVSWLNRHGRWMSRIQKNRKSVFLGIFSSELEAARAYDVAARKHFGKFARTNFGG